MSVLNKNQAASWMMKFAWGLEILLCLTGILIAFTLSYLGSVHLNESLEFDQILILTVGMLPLIGVAFSELLKIPLITGFIYAKSVIAKVVALSILGIICLLTFETMLTGQELLNSLRSEKINDFQLSKNRLSEKIELIDDQIASISSLTPADIKKEANAGIEAQLKSINDQIDDLRAREKSLSSNNDSAEVQDLLRQIDYQQETRETLIMSHRDDLSSINQQRVLIDENEQRELEDTTFFKGNIRDKYAERRILLKNQEESLISEYSIKLSKIDLKINELNKKISLISEPSESLKSSLSLIAAQIIDLQNDKNEIIKNTNAQIELSISEAQNSKSRINELNTQKAEINTELNYVRDELAASAEDSTIHSLAAMYYGVDNLADLTEEQISSFALIFMVTIAFGVTIAGPGTTFIAYKITTEKKANKRNNTARYLVASIIKRLRSPKIVKEVKEVEVEKVITKEIPVEKIKYEKVITPEIVEIPRFVQVPVPTDPKDLPTLDDAQEAYSRKLSIAGRVS